MSLDPRISAEQYVTIITNYLESELVKACPKDNDCGLDEVKLEVEPVDLPGANGELSVRMQPEFSCLYEEVCPLSEGAIVGCLCRALAQARPDAAAQTN